MKSHLHSGYFRPIKILYNLEPYWLWQTMMEENDILGEDPLVILNQWLHTVASARTASWNILSQPVKSDLEGSEWEWGSRNKGHLSAIPLLPSIHIKKLLRNFYSYLMWGIFSTPIDFLIFNQIYWGDTGDWYAKGTKPKSEKDKYHMTSLICGI